MFPNNNNEDLFFIGTISVTTRTQIKGALKLSAVVRRHPELEPTRP